MPDKNDMLVRTRLTRLCAMLAAGFGCTGLLGWALGLPLLTSFGPNWIPMAPSTALLFLLLGIAVFSGAGEGRGNVYRLGIVIESACTLIALLLLVLSLLNITPAAEHLGFTITGSSNGAPLGHMSPLTALSFVLAGAALLVSAPDRPRRAILGFCIACVLVFASTVFMLAYLFGTPVLSGGRFIPPALTTSLAFAVLGTGVWILTGSRAWATDEATDAESPRSVRFLLLVFALVAAGLVTAGYLYFRHQERDSREQIERQLGVIADLKVAELLAYRRERVADGAIFHRNAAIATLVRRVFAHQNDVAAQAELRGWLEKIAVHAQYERAVLLDAQGAVRLSVPASKVPMSSVIATRATELQASGEVGFQDLYRSEFDQRIYLATLVPIFGAEAGARVLGTLVLQIDPNSYFYPLINRWPVPSVSGETVLVRRDGNDALFLNELKHQRNTALSLRIPLARSEIAVAKAALGHEGIVQAPDYRGVPVLASLRQVPGTPWYLVARVDLAEALAPAQANLWLVASMIAVVLAGGGAAVSLAWRQQRRSYLAQRALAAEALAAAEALRLEVAERKKVNDALDASARDLERSNAELEEFAYVASHDLQEPLRMVVGFVQLLERRLADKLDDESREFMGFAVDGALRMQRLIQDILAYSRVSSRDSSVEPVDSAASVREALVLLAHQIAETGAEVDVQALPVVAADRTQLVQLFQNLIGNALKFCKDRAPRIRVEAHRNGAGWRFAVSDNGIGIAPEYRERIFGIFQRLHTRREYPGTGIGLAICKRIVQRHGGEIGVDSAPGGGAVFWFTLPEENKT